MGLIKSVVLGGKIVSVINIHGVTIKFANSWR